MVGVRVLPWALEHVDPVDHVRVVLVTVGVVVLFAAIGQTVGLWAGNRLAPDLRRPARPSRPTGSWVRSPGWWA